MQKRLRRSNTDEIAGSMQDLERMQASVDELREQMGEAQAGLRGSGEGLLKVLEMLQEASHVLGAIRESRKARIRLFERIQYECGESSLLCFLTAEATCCSWSSSKLARHAAHIQMSLGGNSGRLGQQAACAGKRLKQNDPVP